MGKCENPQVKFVICESLVGLKLNEIIECTISLCAQNNNNAHQYKCLFCTINEIYISCTRGHNLKKRIICAANLIIWSTTFIDYPIQTFNLLCLVFSCVLSFRSIHFCLLINIAIDKVIPYHLRKSQYEYDDARPFALGGGQQGKLPPPPQIFRVTIFMGRIIVLFVKREFALRAREALADRRKKIFQSPLSPPPPPRTIPW